MGIIASQDSALESAELVHCPARPRRDDQASVRYRLRETAEEFHVAPVARKLSTYENRTGLLDSHISRELTIELTAGEFQSGGAFLCRIDHRIQRLLNGPLTSHFYWTTTHGSTGVP